MSSIKDLFAAFDWGNGENYWERKAAAEAAVKRWCDSEGITHSEYEVEVIPSRGEKPTFRIDNRGPSLNSAPFYGTADELEAHLRRWGEVRPLYWCWGTMWA